MGDNTLLIQIKADASQMQEGTDAAKEQIERASAAVSNLADAIGIKVPESLEKVMAESKLFGPLLEAAFAPTQVLALLDVLEQVPEKIQVLQDRWAGVSEETKKAFQAQQEYFFRQIDFQAQLEAKELHSSESELSGIQRTAQQITNYEKEVSLLTQASGLLGEAKQVQDYLVHGADRQAVRMANVNVQIAKIADGFKLLGDSENVPYLNEKESFSTFSKEADDVLQKFIEKASEFKNKAEELTKVTIPNLKASLSTEQSDKSIGLNLARLEAQRKVDESEIQLEQQTIREVRAQRQISAEDELALQKSVLDKKYAEEEKYLQAKAVQLNRDRDRNAEQIIAVDGQIKALQAQHQSQLLKLDSDYYKEVEKNGQEAVNKAAERDRKLLADWRAMLESRLQTAAEKAKSEDQLQEQSVEQQLLLGNISKRQEIAQIAALKQNELQIEIDYLKDREKLYQNDAKEIEKIEAQIGKLEAQQAQIGAKAVTDSLKQQKAEYDKLFSGMSSAFSSFTQSLLSGNQSLGQAWAKMIDEMATKFIQGLEQQLMSFIEHKLMEVAVHAQAEATKDAASKASHAKEDERTAYSAAKAAYESVVHTPIIGPILAPIEAAVAFAAVSAMGSAEGGQYIVPQKQLTMLHPQEMVLPAGLASRMRDVVEGRGGGAGGVTVVVNHSVNAVDADSFQGMIRKHGNMIGNEVARVLRKKGVAAS